MRVIVGVRSDVGLVREINEDSYFIEEPLFVVADGMGGHVAGDVASSTAVEVIAGAAGSVDADPDALVQVVRHANSAIWERSQADPALRGMGTTCTLLLIDGRHAHLAHVGDSRAYLLREGELSQLTEDHTLVWRMVREGRMTAQEAEHHPQRNVITRVLGVDSDVDVDIQTMALVEGDRLMLCSDGLSSMVDAETIRRVLSETSEPQEAADRLVDLANQAGGEDNVTVVTLYVTEADLKPDGRGEPALSADGRRTGPDDGATQMRSVPGETNHGAPAPAPPPPPEAVEPPRRRVWVRRLVVVVLVLGVLGVGGYMAARAALSNSYFVGVDSDGMVTIYSGIPDEIVGLTLKREERSTDLALDDLPDFLQDDVEEGRIKTGTLEEAQQRVESLEQSARSFGQEKPTRKKNN